MESKKDLTHQLRKYDQDVGKYLMVVQDQGDYEE